MNFLQFFIVQNFLSSVWLLVYGSTNFSRAPLFENWHVTLATYWSTTEQLLIQHVRQWSLRPVTPNDGETLKANANLSSLFFKSNVFKDNRVSLQGLPFHTPQRERLILPKSLRSAPIKKHLNFYVWPSCWAIQTHFVLTPPDAKAGLWKHVSAEPIDAAPRRSFPIA